MVLTLNSHGWTALSGHPPGAKKYFYHCDQVGSIKAVTDGEGEEVWNGDYLPFGERYGAEGEAGFEEWYGFGGKEYDPDSGLYYFNARWYDEEIGRFITEDSVDDPNNPNLYTYGGNNPLLYIDPTGHNIIDFLAGLLNYNVQNTYTSQYGGQTTSDPGYEVANQALEKSQPFFQYLDDTQQQVLLGNYTDKSTLIGTVIQIGAGIAGVDAPGDIRDIGYDIQNFELSLKHLSQSGLDLVALVSVIGAVKNLKYGDEVANAFKNVIKKETKQLAEAHITDTGKTVLGHYDEVTGGYIAKAQKMKASYFDIGKAWDLLTPAERKAANMHFLDVITERGDKIYLSVPKFEN